MAQALRPYPQYLAVNAQSGGGDKTGRSHYHAGVVKVNQRLTGGVSVQASYTYSRLTTDADSFSGSGRAMDAARPELEWSIGRFDQPHNIKINSVFELPFGAGRRWLRSGIASHIAGGWRIAFIQAYTQRVAHWRDDQCAAEHLQRDEPSRTSPVRTGERRLPAPSSIRQSTDS